MRKILANTPDEARQYVRAALDIVAELDPAEDLRVAVFSAAVGLVSSSTLVQEQPAAMIPLPPHLARGGRH